MLNRDDIELLFEALDALKSKSSSEYIMSTMLGVMLSDSKEQAQSRIEQMERDNQSKKEQQRCLEERIILLKAQLIQMRDKVDIESVFNND